METENQKKVVAAGFAFLLTAPFIVPLQEAFPRNATWQPWVFGTILWLLIGSCLFYLIFRHNKKSEERLREKEQIVKEFERKRDL